MVRLVFRPYTQFRQSICTSELFRTSTRVSSGFVLTRHSSPSFGSQRVRSQVLADVLWDKGRLGCPSRPRCPGRRIASPRPAPRIHYQNGHASAAPAAPPKRGHFLDASRRRHPRRSPHSQSRHRLTGSSLGRTATARATSRGSACSRKLTFISPPGLDNP